MKRTILISVLVLAFSLTANAATTKITTLNQFPFYGWVEDAETARMVVKENIGAVKCALNMLYGLERGNKIFFALCEQINEAAFWQSEVIQGENFKWMLFKSRGFQRVIENLEWAGDNSFLAFMFYIDYKYKRYLFMVPQICGNISLLSVANIARIQTEIEIETEIEEKREINEPLKVELAKPEEAFVKTEEPKVKLPVSLPGSKRLSNVLDLSGAMVRKCYGKYLPGARLGLRYRLDTQDRFVFVLAGGFVMPLQVDQQNSWEPFFLADLTLRSRIYKFISLGAGVGYSSAARNWKVPPYWEGVFNVGVKIKEITAFFETRVALSELENIGKFPSSKMPHKFVFGIRLPIKK